MSKYLITTYNEGIVTKKIETEKSMKDICLEEYNAILKEFRDDCDAFDIVEPWSNNTHDENGDLVSSSMGATIDYCMGHEYIYEISVKVEAA